MRRLALLVLLVAAGARPLDAQVPASMPPVDSGLVIRAWLDSGQMRGRLLMPMRATDDSVRYCALPGRPCRGDATDVTGWLHLASIRHLDVQAGTRWKKGAVWGGVLGLLVSAMAIEINEMCETAYCANSRSENTRRMILGPSIGAAVGAVIGSGFPRFGRRY